MNCSRSSIAGGQHSEFFAQPVRECRVSFYMKHVLALGIFAIALTNSLAQRPGENTSPLPIQGEQIPELTAYDENGEAFSLTQRLKGKHGVIVFGCLT